MKTTLSLLVLSAALLSCSPSLAGTIDAQAVNTAAITYFQVKLQVLNWPIPIPRSFIFRFSSTARAHLQA
jgi:hypothetical protein